MSLQSTLFRAFVAAALTAPALLAQGGLQISVIEGQGAENSIEKGRGAPIVVELRDAAGAPIPHAQVTFEAPADGPGGTFFGASRVSKAWTDDQGRAQAAAMTPNTKPGPYTILVKAEHSGSTASAEIQQSNVAPTGPEKKKKRRLGKKVWIPIVASVIIVIIGLAQRD